MPRPAPRVAIHVHKLLAAEVWHWWIGVALTGVAVLVSVGLIGLYLATVTAKQHPGRKNRRQSDL
jgi:hypothetical protein